MLFFGRLRPAMADEPRNAPKGGVAKMNNIDRLLESTDSILLIDWPGEDCPRTMLRAGFSVFGQEPSGWLRYELKNYQLLKHPVATPPKHIDLVFCYRPVEELTEYVATAQKLTARIFWYQSGLVSASTEYLRGCWLLDDTRAKVRKMIEEAGLIYIDEVYIADAVRAMDICKPRQSSG
jgi:CoA binding protein